MASAEKHEKSTSPQASSDHVPIKTKIIPETLSPHEKSRGKKQKSADKNFLRHRDINIIL